LRAIAARKGIGTPEKIIAGVDAAETRAARAALNRIKLS
jgi:hypothetical protein